MKMIRILIMITFFVSLVPSLSLATNHTPVPIRAQPAAQTPNKGYVPLATLPGLTTTPGQEKQLADYLIILYKIGIWTAVILAIASIIWGGVQYITSAGGEGKGAGKEMIQSAIFGLLLALGSYIILSTINKDLLELDFTIDQQQQ